MQLYAYLQLNVGCMDCLFVKAKTLPSKKKWTVEARPKEEILKTERQIRFELSVIKWYYAQIAQGKTNVKVSEDRKSVGRERVC